MADFKPKRADIFVVAGTIILMAILFSLFPHSYCRVQHAIEGEYSRVCGVQMAKDLENPAFCTETASTDDCLYYLIGEFDSSNQCVMLENVVSKKAVLFSDACYFYFATEREMDPNLCERIEIDEGEGNLRDACFEELGVSG